MGRSYSDISLTHKYLADWDEIPEDYRQYFRRILAVGLGVSATLMEMRQTARIGRITNKD